MAFWGGEDMVRAKDYTWQKSRYTLLKGRWGIAIWIEAGYLMTSEIEDKNNYTEISDHIYFECGRIAAFLQWPENDKQAFP